MHSRKKKRVLHAYIARTAATSRIKRDSRTFNLMNEQNTPGNTTKSDECHWELIFCTGKYFLSRCRPTTDFMSKKFRNSYRHSSTEPNFLGWKSVHACESAIGLVCIRQLQLYIGFRMPCSTCITNNPRLFSSTSDLQNTGNQICQPNSMLRGPRTRRPGGKTRSTLVRQLTSCMTLNFSEQRRKFLSDYDLFFENEEQTVAD